MDLDQECHLPAVKKSSLEDAKREEKSCLHNKLNSLKKRSQFLFVRKRGKTKKSQFYIVNYLYSNTNEIRFGITVSRKYGNAVNRNYVKRLIRSILRNNANSFLKGLNLEIIPKKNLKSKRFFELEDDLLQVIKNLVI